MVLDLYSNTYLLKSQQVNKARKIDTDNEIV